MRLSKHRHSTKLEMNMTPMIDVIFLLIIFFMTVNQVSQANSERVQLPRLAGSQDQSRSPLIIDIDVTGMISAEGRTFSAAAALVPLVKNKIVEEHGDPARVNVVLRADRRGDCRIVNEVVNLLVKLDINRVRVAVQSGER